MEIRVLDERAVHRLLPERDPWGHKGDFGRLLLLCGSVGYTGAAALAARAAVRSGAGLVFLGVPRSIYAIEAVKLDEPIVFPLPDDGSCLSASAIPEILERLQRCDVCLVGPGLGQGPGVLPVVQAVLEKARCPVVLDADGINVLAAHKDRLRERTGVTILTPHDGEFARLGGGHGDRLEDTAALAKDLKAVILRKGHRTLVTDGERAYENRTGNAGMATGGSGDVLAGLLTALLGQSIPPLEAAACAAWLHGRAGDLCAQTMGQYGMTPSDMVKTLPRLLK
ncbi:MAG: NAD(P)H-hydrate dehydratase [Candidatus Faecousia sp.]|nr:NAD(P)H-hydrate dehydratase [Clostridiales bacterium]MDD7652492.1 NAD(P)H-hydrate dehydratase [Bacillota bacterium]MDY4220469.1 NAD(P)H-hydrate dehydratase [Candidatus Faecousia sp.]